MQDIMLDLETLGTRPGSAIVSIGAVYFDLTEQKLGAEFYAVIDLRQSPSPDMLVDMDTVCWWMKQSEEARAVFQAKTAIGLRGALNLFNDFARPGLEPPRVWGNGANFDNVVLEAAYLKAGVAVSWPFYMDRCYRTMRAHYKELGIDPPFVRQGTFHNALDDAKSQALHLMKIVGVGLTVAETGA